MKSKLTFVLSIFTIVACGGVSYFCGQQLGEHVTVAHLIASVGALTAATSA